MLVTLSAVHYHSKGNPCHELPGCCAKNEGVLWVSGCSLEFSSGIDCMRLCYRELCLQCCSLIAVFPALQCVAWQPPSKRRTNYQRGGFHHEEGAPTLLFLMVASEHSASEESQSESPNCSGFWKKHKQRQNVWSFTLFMESDDFFFFFFAVTWH